MPRGGRPGYFAKGDFKIDLEHDCVTCPAGQTTRKWKLKKVRRGVRGECVAVKQFEFAAERCRGCVHYRQCVSSKLGKGRSVVLHPEEGLLQEARAYQETAAFREDTKLRQTVEHRLARLVQLGIRQARYFGRVKTKWQLLLAAAVANLVLVAAWESTTGTSLGIGAASFSLLLQLTFLLLLVPNLIGMTKRRQRLVFTASTRGCVPQTPVSGRTSRSPAGNPSCGRATAALRSRNPLILNGGTIVASAAAWLFGRAPRGGTPARSCDGAEPWWGVNQGGGIGRLTAGSPRPTDCAVGG